MMREAERITGAMLGLLGAEKRLTTTKATWAPSQHSSARLFTTFKKG
jgi:hypothetical protein